MMSTCHCPCLLLLHVQELKFQLHMIMKNASAMINVALSYTHTHTYIYIYMQIFSLLTNLWKNHLLILYVCLNFPSDCWGNSQLCSLCLCSCTTCNSFGSFKYHFQVWDMVFFMKFASFDTNGCASSIKF